MAFLTKCTISKNEPRIWRRLSGMGLKGNPAQPLRASAAGRLAVDRGSYFDGEGMPLDGYVDCGADEGMFFALAALRDDTDQDQLFIYDDFGSGRRNPRRFWFRCGAPNVAAHLPYYDLAQFCRKATAEEIIAEFKDGYPL